MTYIPDWTEDKTTKDYLNNDLIFSDRYQDKELDNDQQLKEDEELVMRPIPKNDEIGIEMISAGLALLTFWVILILVIAITIFHFQRS